MSPTPASLKSYVVTWAIDIEAESPLDAARHVAAWMQDSFTLGDDAFEITDKETGATAHVDLADHSP